MIAGSRQLQAHKDRRVKGGHIMYYFMLHIIDSPGRLQLDGEGGGECVTYNIRLRGFVCVCVGGGGRGRGAARRHTLALPTLPPPRALRLPRWHCQRSALARGMCSGTICAQSGSVR